MITEDYVSFETAKLLKEKGFDEEVLGYYHIWDSKINPPVWGAGTYVRSEAPHLYIKAPTLQMAIKWLNEVHHILVVSDYEYECTDTSWYYKIYRLGEYGKPERIAITGVSDRDEEEHIVGFLDYKRSYKDYATRKEADEEGIRYVLENLI